MVRGRDLRRAWSGARGEQQWQRYKETKLGISLGMFAVFGLPALIGLVPYYLHGGTTAELVAALHQAGFTAVAELRHGYEVLEVVCHDEHDRGTVREVLEHAHRSGFDSPENPVGAISFEDER